MAELGIGSGNGLAHRAAPSLWLGSAKGPDDETPPAGGDAADVTGAGLPIRVEVWDATESFVEHVVALTSNRAIGFAAFYSAKDQYPRRIITLRDNHGVLSRWSGKRQ